MSKQCAKNSSLSPGVFEFNGSDDSLFHLQQGGGADVSVCVCE